MAKGFKISLEDHAKFVAALRARQAERNHRSLRDRLAAKAAEHGPDSIYAEMLAEMSEMSEKRALTNRKR